MIFENDRNAERISNHHLKRSINNVGFEIKLKEASGSDENKLV